jgi:tRNA pseudouridine32 synthase/23S rRNA pseudouridine746 synthase
MCRYISTGQVNVDESKPLTAQSVSSFLNASTVVLPHGHWSTVLDCLCDRFPAISRACWQDRFARGMVLDQQQQPLSMDTPHKTGLRVFYFREVVDEPIIPFTETILYMDEHILVADKPHFLPVTPAGRYVSQTLLARLMTRTNNLDLQPLHRLDRHTAGLVLFSMQKQSRGAYQALFRDQKIHKSYEAIAPALPHVTFPHHRASRIVQADSFFLSQEVVGTANAETTIDVLERGGPYWHYRLDPVSGKKHQLRIHLAALGAPICNDMFYPVVCDEEMDNYDKPLQLLAREVSFVDPVLGIPRYFRSQLVLKSVSSITT